MVTVLHGLLKYRLGKQWRLNLLDETLMEEADITSSTKLQIARELFMQRWAQ